MIANHSIMPHLAQQGQRSQPEGTSHRASDAECITADGVVGHKAAYTGHQTVLPRKNARPQKKIKVLEGTSQRTQPSVWWTLSMFSLTTGVSGTSQRRQPTRCGADTQRCRLIAEMGSTTRRVGERGPAACPDSCGACHLPPSPHALRWCVPHRLRDHTGSSRYSRVLSRSPPCLLSTPLILSSPANPMLTRLATWQG